MIGRVTIKALLDIKLEKTIVVLTDKDGNPAPMRIDKSRDDRVFEHENGNALKLTFDELAPLDDVLTTEKTLSVSKEKTYLHTIGALLEYINGDITGVKKPPSFASEADMIATIEAHYKNNHKQGLKARKLQENFALAKAKLNES